MPTRPAASGLAPLLVPHLPRHRGALAGSCALTVAGIVVDLARPWPLAVAVDRLLSSPTPATALTAAPLLLLAGLAALGALLTVLSAVLDARATLLAETTAERIGADLRADVFGRTVRLGLPWHDRMRSGELVARLTSDVGRVMDGLVAATAVLVPETLALVALVVVMAVLDPVLCLVALTVVPGLWWVGLRQRREVRTAQTEARAANGTLAAQATDLLRTIGAVHAFGQQERVEARFAVGTDQVRAAETEALRTRARWAPRAESLLAVGSALVLLVGGWQVLQGQHTIGELLVVLAYSRDLATPVRSLTRLSGSLAKAGASADRLTEVLTAEGAATDRPGAIGLPTRAHTVRFERVTHRYGDRPGLRDLDLRVGAGETVALVGPSGSGKSTALSLLLRLREADAGTVSIDGVDVRDVRLASLRRHVALVPQEGWLFDGTLLENVLFGCVRPCRADAVAAGRLAALDDVVATLPQGWDTPLGEGGGRLSGGQRRRVALARAVATGAPVLLLDEPTASLDEVTARQVIESVRRLGQHRTVLVATHDPALAAIADRVVDLRDATPPEPGLTQPLRKEVDRHDDQPDRPSLDASPRPLAQPLAQPSA